MVSLIYNSFNKQLFLFPHNGQSPVIEQLESHFPNYYVSNVYYFYILFPKHDAEIMICKNGNYIMKQRNAYDNDLTDYQNINAMFPDKYITKNDRSIMVELNESYTGLQSADELAKETEKNLNSLTKEYVDFDNHEYYVYSILNNQFTDLTVIDKQTWINILLSAFSLNGISIREDKPKKLIYYNNSAIETIAKFYKINVPEIKKILAMPNKPHNYSLESDIIILLQNKYVDYHCLTDIGKLCAINIFKVSIFVGNEKIDCYEPKPLIVENTRIILCNLEDTFMPLRWRHLYYYGGKSLLSCINTIFANSNIILNDKQSYKIIEIFPKNLSKKIIQSGVNTYYRDVTTISENKIVSNITSSVTGLSTVLRNILDLLHPSIRDEILRECSKQNTFSDCISFFHKSDEELIKSGIERVVYNTIFYNRPKLENLAKFYDISLDDILHILCSHVNIGEKNYKTDIIWLSFANYEQDRGLIEKMTEKGKLYLKLNNL